MFFENKTAFSIHIEEIVKEHACSYIDAMLYYAEVSGAEYEDMAGMMSPCLVEKVKLEAQEAFHLPENTTAMIDDRH